MNTSDRNKIKLAALLPVMEAWINGAEVEYRLAQSNEWAKTKTPSWDYRNIEYRIAVKRPDSIDWSHVHPDYKWMARDCDGASLLFKSRPEHGKYSWSAGVEPPTAANGFASLVTGETDWKDSLVKRP